MKIAYGDPNLQDVIMGVENVDTMMAYINVETPTGTVALKKTSEDGVVSGISFTIKGDGFNKTVKTDKNGNITVEGLFPGTYTVTEQSIDRYEPQKTQTVTIIGGKTSTVTFSNTLKRGSLEVVKTSEDNLVEGVKFHLYGTSLSGLAVDEYAITDKNGLAKFENVLISGGTPYTLEEVDTAIRYVVPACAGKAHYGESRRTRQPRIRNQCVGSGKGHPKRFARKRNLRPSGYDVDTAGGYTAVYDGAFNAVKLCGGQIESTLHGI